MTALTEHGPEIAHFLTARGALCSVREDGVTLVRTVADDGWRVHSRKKPDVALEDWRRRKQASVLALPAWRRACDQLPSMAELEAWLTDSTCETPSGDTVDPDGRGPDGAPSWLLLLGFV